ncbi:hypothetical protein PR002_g31573 [Phytophthora rubi]|uniref:Uncharacterized protein n=1 Tax=Phytophthora rubi TaxID=129364 RepID=A0A6A3GGZ2_9STRA|nr:hypothetical protein PR002_g31573 [Phytophthora rubi]
MSNKAWLVCRACCCLFWGVFVRASAVGFVVKYLVANEMPRVRFPDGAFSLPHRLLGSLTAPARVLALWHRFAGIRPGSVDMLSGASRRHGRPTACGSRQLVGMSRGGGCGGRRETVDGGMWSV